jgi:hypothetical protein
MSLQSGIGSGVRSTTCSTPSYDILTPLKTSWSPWDAILQAWDALEMARWTGNNGILAVGEGDDALPMEDNGGTLRTDGDSNDMPSGGSGAAGTICGNSSIADGGSKGVKGTLGTGDFGVVDG